MINFFEVFGVLALVMVVVALLLYMVLVGVWISELKDENRDLKERILSFDLSHHRISHGIRQHIEEVESEFLKKVNRRDSVLRVLAKRNTIHGRQIECLKKGKANKVTPKKKAVS